MASVELALRDYPSNHKDMDPAHWDAYQALEGALYGLKQDALMDKIKLLEQKSSRLDSLELRVTQLEAELEAKTQEVEQQKAELEGVRQLLTAATEENTRLQDRLLEIERNVQEKEQRIEQLNQELCEARARSSNSRRGSQVASDEIQPRPDDLEDSEASSEDEADGPDVQPRSRRSAAAGRSQIERDTRQQRTAQLAHERDVWTWTAIAGNLTALAGLPLLIIPPAGITVIGIGLGVAVGATGFATAAECERSQALNDN